MSGEMARGVVECRRLGGGGWHCRRVDGDVPRAAAAASDTDLDEFVRRLTGGTVVGFPGVADHRGPDAGADRHPRADQDAGPDRDQRDRAVRGGDGGGAGVPLAAAARADRDAVPAVRDAQPRPALPVAGRLAAVRTGVFNDSLARHSGADILHHFARTQDAGWVEGILVAAEAFGQVPMVTLEPWDRDGHLALPGAGDIEALADAFRDHEGEVLVRYMHEFNYEWYPWGGNPDMFCREWDRFFGSMPPNVKAVWCPNVPLSIGPNVPLSIGPTIGRWLATGRRPDVIGLDAYAKDGRYAFGDLFGNAIWEVQRVMRLPQPVMVCETAVPRGTKQAQWVREMWRWVAENAPGLHAVCWFGIDKEANWALTDKARAAFLAKRAA